MTPRTALPLLLGPVLVVCAACGVDDRERLIDAPLAATTSRDVLVTELHAGPAMAPRGLMDYREDSVAVWEGMRLYNWYNCNGCHLNGGGGIGPPLGDDRWIYGREPLQIYSAIMEGLPDGMPAYGGRLSHGEALRIVAYVRSLTGLTERRLEMWPTLGQHMHGDPVLGAVGPEPLPLPQPR